MNHYDNLISSKQRKDLIMWHNLKDIAENFRFNAKDFTDFANANKDRFKIDKEQVGTWYVGDLVSAYQQTQTEFTYDFCSDKRNGTFTVFAKDIETANGLMSFYKEMYGFDSVMLKK